MSQAGAFLTLDDLVVILGRSKKSMRTMIRAPHKLAFGRLPFVSHGEGQYSVPTAAFKTYYDGIGRRQGTRCGYNARTSRKMKALKSYRALTPPEVLTPDVATSLEAAGVVLARAEDRRWRERLLEVKERTVVASG
jgi:hypothetical protein